MVATRICTHCRKYEIALSIAAQINGTPESQFTEENLSGLPAPICLAQKMGEKLAVRQILQRAMRSAKR
jgi:hypothetical protein